MSDDETILISMRVADMSVPEQGAKRSKCDLCGEAIWISPSSRAVTKCYCMQCATDTIEPDAKFEPITQQQLDAIREYFKKYGN